MKRFSTPLSLRLTRVSLLAAILSIPMPATAVAQLAKSPPPSGADRHTAVVGQRYENGGFSRFLFGGGYRDLWTTPIEFDVLDFQSIAGGLTPTRTGGYGQTVSLKLLGGNGLEYEVRSIDKDPTRRLDSLFMGTIVARIVQDQVGQFLPTAGLIVDPLLDATGILHPRHQLVVIPDDPALGEYREDFAGLLGMFSEDAQEGPDNSPGFAGSTRISGSVNFLEELEEGACNRADAREYLKARLMDMIVGDRDRHAGQFRWARFPDGDDCYMWRVVPEDRDQAFIMNDGFVMTMFRLVRPQQVRFGPDFPSLVGLTYNGWELDRQILVELELPVWQDVAREIQLELTDDVIDNAVAQLPPEHFALRGAFLSNALKSRRDQLATEAVDFYHLISKQAQIKGTDRDEHAVFEHLQGGDLRVTLSYLNGPRSGSPYFERTFHRSETREVRFFMQGGDDFAEIRGVQGQIRVRAIGGGGDDRYLNSSPTSGGNTRFYDDRGDNEFEGTGRVDDRSFERSTSTNLVHRYALDWGGVNRFLPALSYDSDVGFYVGLTAGFQKYGFRKVPWESDNAFTLGVGSTGPEFFFGWNGRYRNVIWGGDLTFEAHYTGLDVLRFTGFGNETAFDEESEFFQVEQQQITFAPALEWSWGLTAREGEQEISIRGFHPKATFGIGPVYRFSNAPEDDNAVRFIGQLDPAPVGLGNFSQLGGRAFFEIDTSDSPGYRTNGIRMTGGGAFFPAVLDAEESFGNLHGSVSTYLTPGGARRAPTLALRAGAEAAFGTYPFHEAAYLGGGANVRGFRSQRFAGDTAVFGNAELRLPVAQFYLLFPAEFGFHGAADVGRIFFDGDPTGADTWHSAFGGGFWLSFLNRSQTLSASYMSGDEQSGIYIQAGMHF